MIGQTISHYRIVGKLGEGGMGVVYKAEDTRLERTVALKFPGAHMIADEDSRRRFIREAKAAASLDHPNICTVYEVDEAEGKVFIAMACIEGRSLTEAIAGGPMKLPEALDIARQAARGLQEAHSKGVVHRDIKPANVMVGATGAGERLVKIMDFGLAQLAGATKLTRTDTTLGTIAYMSPEQTQGTAVDQRSDIWSLGAVLYEMITGQQAFKGHYDQAVMYSILNEEPEPVTAVRSGVPIELEWILGKALAKTAERRYHSALEFAVDLDTVLAKLASSGSTTARSVARVVPPPMHPGEPADSTVGPGAEGSADSLSQQRRRRARDVLLELGSQGVLPDRILSQALDLMAKPQEQMLPAEKRRDELLAELQARHIRVGEFIEQWQQVEIPASRPAAAPAPSPPASSMAPPASPPSPAQESARHEPARRSNGLEAACSLIVPGLGQLLQGRIGRGLLQVGLATLLWIVLLGWIIHIWSVVDAARYTPSGPDPMPEPAVQSQQSAMPPPGEHIAEPSVAARSARGWRTQAEIFGWPLIHCVRGVDPATGKRLIARGVIAVGEIAVGVIACGGVALGGIAVGVVSGGILAVGAFALGLSRSVGLVAAGTSPLGFATLPLFGDTFLGGLLRVVALVFLVRLLVRRRRFRKQFGDDGGAVSVWSILSGREWRSDGTPFRGGNVVATLGACEVDLSETTLAGPEVKIEATAIGGAIKIVVPPGWRTVTQGTQLLGGYANKTRPPQSGDTRAGNTETAPRLIVKGFVIGGAVEIVHPEL